MAAGLKGLAQLSDDPLRSRVSSHVEVRNLPASALDDEEAVQHVECQGWHGEKVERAAGASVINCWWAHVNLSDCNMLPPNLA
jgi:hypothetical protein